MIVSVTLEWYEQELAAAVGLRRHMEAIRQGRCDQHGANGSYQLHLDGAAGECAFAKGTDRYWPASVNVFKKEPDFPPNIEIRLRTKVDYELLVRHDDDDKRIFVLVQGSGAAFQLKGWLYGHEAKQDKWLATHGGREAAFFPPTIALHNVYDLPRS